MSEATCGCVLEAETSSPDVASLHPGYLLVLRAKLRLPVPTLDRRSRRQIIHVRTAGTPCPTNRSKLSSNACAGKMPR